MKYPNLLKWCKIRPVFEDIKIEGKEKELISFLDRKWLTEGLW